MKMMDTLLIRRLDRRTGTVLQAQVSGVYCTVTEAIRTDDGGFCRDGQITVRIPGTGGAQVECGDEISRAGSNLWFTAVEVRDNRKSDSGLSHWKVIGRR